MTSSIKFPCKVCEAIVNDNDQAIQFDLCNYWIHINYNERNYFGFYFNNDSWYCILCCSQIFPSNSLKSNRNFSMRVSNFHKNQLKL